MAIKTFLMKSLLIISDTPFYLREQNIAVFEPTLREIEEVADLFSTVKWISYKREGNGDKNARVPVAPNIKLHTIRNFRGGQSLWKKFWILISIPWQAFLLYREIPNFNVVHTRAPSVPALLVIVFSFFDSKRIYWHKYAGNWADSNLPLAYRLQHWLLRKLNKPNVRVTINGKWPGLHSGFLFMENPCLKSDYLKKLETQVAEKTFEGKLKVCFVGNLDPFKGAARLVQALLADSILSHIESVWIVGDGPEKEELEVIAATAPFPIHLCGYLSREKIFESIYSSCHVMVLPSETEGFPKVVSEAAAHRCIPVVTAVSSIDQYIHDCVNGFLLEDSSIESIRTAFVSRIIPHEQLAGVADEAQRLANIFTYERFHDRIKHEVLGE